MEACRLWLIAYNLHFLHASNNERWKTQISRCFGEKRNWYLRNKQKYGNARYIIPRGVTYYLFAASISIFSAIAYYSIPAVQKYGHLYPLIDGALFSVPTTIIVYGYWTCRKYHELNDNLLFHYEFKVSVFIFVSTIVVYPFVSMPIFFGEMTLGATIALCLVMYSYYIPSLISTLWIPRKIMSTQTWKHNKSLSMLEMVVSDNNDREANTKPNKLTIEELVRDEGAFETLIHWMYREFSHENILCFIEMVQFKQYLIDMVKSNPTEKHTDELKCEYTFYANMPASSIVHGDTMDVKTPTSQRSVLQLPSFVDVASKSESKATSEVDDECKRIARDLYKKYVCIAAEFEVNISATLRRSYQVLDEQNWELNVIDMITVFDDVIEQALYFIRQSYIRSQIGV